MYLAYAIIDAAACMKQYAAWQTYAICLRICNQMVYMAICAYDHTTHMYMRAYLTYGDEG